MSSSGTSLPVDTDPSSQDPTPGNVLKRACRACTEAKHMFDAFSQFTSRRHNSSSSTGPVQDTSGPSQISSSGSGGAQTETRQPFWFYEENMPCPPDITELGRATWTLLHTMAAYYPENPSPQQQELMRTVISGLGAFYPCEECAGHLRKELSKHPPLTSSSEQLSQWACDLHNLVNIRLGKPKFDCSLVFQRWRDGHPDVCGPTH